MGISDWFKKDQTKIRVIKQIEAGLVFQVINGRRALGLRFGVASNKVSLLSLCLNGRPLVKFHHEDEYFCPTCQKLVSAGYGLDSCGSEELAELREKINAPFESLEKSFEHLKPILGLLDDGFYLLSDLELIPTDGQGNFFWTLGNKPSISMATCMFYDRESCEWTEVRPQYLTPTQPPERFNPERAKHYRGLGDRRALAYYSLGYLCALLDGHHKAVAAALDGRPVKTLLISPGHYFSSPLNKRDWPDGGRLFFYGDLYITERETGWTGERLVKSFSNRTISPAEADKCLAAVNAASGSYNWPPEILATADQYLSVSDYASLGWAGDLSEKRLEDVLEGRETISTAATAHLVKALFAVGSPSFIDFCIGLYKKGCEAELMYVMFPLLAKRRSPQVEEFFIDFVINDEGLRPRLTKIVDDYLKKC